MKLLIFASLILKYERRRLMITNKEYINETYCYTGLWGVPSVCGIMTVRKPDRFIVIATELHDENAGTSVTEWCPHIAHDLMQREVADLKDLIFIVHSPDRKSKYEFYAETFHQPKFENTHNSLKIISWQRIEKSTVDALLSN